MKADERAAEEAAQVQVGMDNVEYASRICSVSSAAMQRRRSSDQPSSKEEKAALQTPTGRGTYKYLAQELVRTHGRGQCVLIAGGMAEIRCLCWTAACRHLVGLNPACGTGARCFSSYQVLLAGTDARLLRLRPGALHLLKLSQVRRARRKKEGTEREQPDRGDKILRS